MNILIFMSIGLIIGWLASRLEEDTEGKNAVQDISISLAGALVGGFIFDIFKMANTTFWDKAGMSLTFAVFSLYIASFFPYEHRDVFGPTDPLT